MGISEMLTEQGIQNDIKRRGWMMLPYLVFAFVSVLVYFLLIKIIVDPPPASITATLLIFPAFAIFLVPTVYGVKKAQRVQIICPACHKDLNRKVQRVLRTRCCPECGKQIVEGPMIS